MRSEIPGIKVLRKTYPPNWDLIKKYFPEVDEARVVITYDGCIYMPAGNLELTHDLIEHEMVHVMQQKAIGADVWWKRFCEEPEFRLSQELGAYHYQYTMLKNKIKDRNKLSQELWRLAVDLSSPSYGRMIAHSDAMRRIKEGV